jgi:hypothetical protein
VRQSDLVVAQELLHSSHTTMHALATDDDASNSTGTIRCPRCHHTDVVCRHQPQPTDTLLTRLRLWLLAPEKPQCHCFHCGLDFEG